MLRLIQITLFFVAFYCFIALPTRNQPALRITGQVLDDHNNGLAAAHVRLYRGYNQLIGQTRSEKNGSYSIEFNTGDSITLVRYDLTGWSPGRVERISGAKDHVINKVLLRSDQAKNSPPERAELISTLSMFRSIDRANGITEVAFDKQYAAVIAALDLPTAEQRGWNYAHKQLSALSWQDNSIATILLKIKDPQVKRIDNDTLRVRLEAVTDSSAWKVWTVPVKEGQTLHLWAVGEKLNRPSEIAAYLYMSHVAHADYQAGDINKVVIHSAGGDFSVNLPRN